MCSSVTLDNKVLNTRFAAYKTKRLVNSVKYSSVCDYIYGDPKTVTIRQKSIRFGYHRICGVFTLELQ